MMKKLVLLLSVLFLTDVAFGWGRTGHDAISYIAECNLTPKAKRNIEKYLGHSIVYDASWMDRYRHTPAYKMTSAWHSNTVGYDGVYIPSPKGDAVSAIEAAMDLLDDYRSLDDSTVVVNIRYLIHLVEDMHCPTHVRLPCYKRFSFDLNGQKQDFHAFWDSGIIERVHHWGYVEYAHQLDRCSEREKREIAAGTPREWLAESALECAVIYDWTKPGQRFSKDETTDLLNLVHPFAERQMLKAAYRLAEVLNQLFG